MVNSEAMRNLNNPQKPVTSRSNKWKNIIRPIWEKHVKNP